MNPEIKAKWLDKLRDPETEQTRNMLKCGTGFCCLGVLTDIYLKKNNRDWESDDSFKIGEYSFEYTALPREVMEWAGLPTRDPSVELEDGDGDVINTCLTILNDDLRKSFSEIADLIEEQL